MASAVGDVIRILALFVLWLSNVVYCFRNCWHGRILASCKVERTGELLDGVLALFRLREDTSIVP